MLRQGAVISVAASSPSPVVEPVCEKISSTAFGQSMQGKTSLNAQPAPHVYVSNKHSHEPITHQIHRWPQRLVPGTQSSRSPAPRTPARGKDDQKRWWVQQLTTNLSS